MDNSKLARRATYAGFPPDRSRHSRTLRVSPQPMKPSLPSVRAADAEAGEVAIVKDAVSARHRKPCARNQSLLRRRRRLAPRQNRRLVTRSVPAASAFGAKKRLTSFVALSARMEAHRFAPARLALSRASCSDATARASATATSRAFCRTLTMPISSISVGEEPITKSLPPHRRLQSATSSRRLNLLRLLRQRRRRLRSAWVLVA